MIAWGKRRVLIAWPGQIVYGKPTFLQRWEWRNEPVYSRIPTQSELQIVRQDILLKKNLNSLAKKLIPLHGPLLWFYGGVIDRLLDKADTIIIGGGMAYTFALANGKSVGDVLWAG